MVKCEDCGARMTGQQLFCKRCSAPAPGHGKQCAHCRGSGVCTRVLVRGWFRKRFLACEDCCRAAGVRRPRSGQRVPCATCAGQGILRA